MTCMLTFFKFRLTPRKGGINLYPLTKICILGLLMTKDGNPLAKWGLQAGQKALWHRLIS